MTKDMLIVKVQFIGVSTNKIYSGIHWTKRKRLADEAHLAVKIACKGVDKFDGKADLEFMAYTATRSLDTSNYSYTCKMIEDGLVACGILAGDGQKNIGSITILPPVKIPSNEKGYVVVSIKASEY